MTAMGAMIGEAEMTEEMDMTKEAILIIKNKIGIVQNVVIQTFRSELNVIAVARKREEEAALNAMTAEVEMIDVAETTDMEAGMTAEAEMTEEVILSTTKIGIVQNVVILTLHSELNVIAVVRKRAEEAALNAMTAEVETTDVAVEMTAEAEMTEEVILSTIKTGIVQNAVILTLHSELNVIVVARKRAEEALALSATTAEVEMTDVDVMTDVVVEITDVEETTAKRIVAPIQIMIGNAKNVTTQISHSERTVTVVASLKVELVSNHLLGGKAMTEEQVNEKRHLNQGLEIGIVRSVENRILQSEMTASVVAVQSE